VKKERIEESTDWGPMRSDCEDRLKLEALDIVSLDGECTQRCSRSAKVRRCLAARIVPTIVMFALILLQVEQLHRIWVGLTRHGDAILAAEFTRSGLYLVFLAVPVGAFVLHDEPTTADRRPLILAVAIAASFMLVLLGLFPGGPLLLRLPVAWPLAALWVTVGGVAFGVGSVICLGMSFSFRPEARRLCQRGPYRLVRHPIYLAEILVTMGALVANPRMTMVGGELVFIFLQIVRIRAEEQLLGRALPDYREFEQSVPFRLAPLVW